MSGTCPKNFFDLQTFPHLVLMSTYGLLHKVTTGLVFPHTSTLFAPHLQKCLTLSYTCSTFPHFLFTLLISFPIFWEAILIFNLLQPQAHDVVYVSAAKNNIVLLRGNVSEVTDLHHCIDFFQNLYYSKEQLPINYCYPIVYYTSTRFGCWLPSSNYFAKSFSIARPLPRMEH